MIASWMITATLFTLLLGIAALAAERALRLAGRQGRGPWLIALAAAITWPFLAPFAAALLPEGPGTDAPAVIPVVTAAVGAIATIPSLPQPWLARVDAALLWLWGLISLALLVRLGLALRALSAVARVADRDVVAGVTVLVTSSIGPAAFGARRSRLLVPRWLLDLESSWCALAIQHEEEHRRAGDPQLRVAIAVALALVPWNLGMWWIARRLRLAMELDCDARVLRVTRDPERYSRLLLLIAQRQSQTEMAAMLAESNSDLSRRITEMHSARPANPWKRVTVLAFLAALALACSSEYASDLATTPADREREAVAPTYYSPVGATPTVMASGSRAPVYPEQARTARMEGEVLAAFVVDSNGLVLPGSLRILETTHAVFSDAVSAAMAGMRFVPPEVNGRKVRQLVQQPFLFKLASETTGTLREIEAPAARPTADSTNRNPMTLRSIVILGVQ